MKIFYLGIFLNFCIALSGQSKVSGTIKNVEDKSPLIGAIVSIPELNKGTMSDENGNFSLDNLPSGHFHIQISSVGFMTQIIHCDMLANEKTLNLELEPMLIQTQEVVVSGGSYSTQHENAIKIEILNLSEPKNHGTFSMIHSLALIPGIDMISKGIGISTPVIRGLSLSNILVLNDGIRLENYQFSENHPFMIDESGVERIEIIKGPASLLFGSDAVGGVINVIKEKPAPEGKYFGDAGVSYFSNTNGIGSGFGFKTSQKGFFFGLRGNFKSHMDFIDGNGSTVFNSRTNEHSIKFTAGLSRNFGKIALFYDYNKSKFGVTNEVSILETNENSRENEKWYQDLSNHLIALKNTLYLSNFKLNLNLSYQSNLRKEIENQEDIHANMRFSNFLYELKLYVPTSEKHDIILGVQGAFKGNKNILFPGHVLPDYSSTDFSAFGLYQQKIGDHVQIQSGLRFDNRSIFVPSQEKENHDNPEIIEMLEQLDENFSNFSGSLGATLELSKQFLFRLNYSNAFRTPNVAELVQDGIHENRYEQGTRTLKSQRSHEADLSFHLHSKYFTTDFATFYNYIDNYIYLSPTNETSDEGFTIYRYTQSKSNLSGFETGAAIQPFKWMNYRIAYAWIRAENAEGESLPFIPQNKITNDIELKFSILKKAKELNFHLSGTYAFNQDKPSINETPTDGYLVFNSNLGLTLDFLNQEVHFGIGVHNLFNQKYFDHLSTLKEVGFYNMGRSINLSMKFKFTN